MLGVIIIVICAGAIVNGFFCAKKVCKVAGILGLIMYIGIFSTVYYKQISQINEMKQNETQMKHYQKQADKALAQVLTEVEKHPEYKKLIPKNYCISSAAVTLPANVDCSDNFTFAINERNRNLRRVYAWRFQLLKNNNDVNLRARHFENFCICQLPYRY